jgi:hypothetical protein
MATQVWEQVSFAQASAAVSALSDQNVAKLKGFEDERSGFVAGLVCTG